MMGTFFNIEVDGVDMRDYPDFCDAFISYAEDAEGNPLSEEERESIDSEIVYDAVIKSLY